MEQLILFLLKNWYIVLIALTFLYQVNKRKQGAKGSGAPKTGMPTFGSGARGPAQPAPAKRAPQKAAAAARPKAPASGAYAHAEDDAYAVKPPKSAKASPFGASPQAAGESSVYAGDLTAALPFPAEPKPEQVLQGVVWAEILGPPRAKKPYRR
ncbi:hypothetical protein ABE504_15205 [Paenibacillus oryzisoli]|uniref:hypothetical protein n=1 Tax=Paenibacillus oryzisoli TaxID=1850517 RepID=UPI003D2ABAFE